MVDWVGRSPYKSILGSSIGQNIRLLIERLLVQIQPEESIIFLTLI